MREYAKISPKFWNGATGKALKTKGSEAVIVALYLMTCQHANMLGLYYLSKAYIAVDTGLGFEGASKGLQWACEVGFCHYDEATEVVWVEEMALFQIDAKLEAKDLRCKGVQREYDSTPENPYLTRFYERYGEAFKMTACRGVEAPKTRSSQAPSKPLLSQEQEQEKEQEQKKEQDGSAATAPAAPKGSRLSTGWMLPKAWGEWSMAEFPAWTVETVRKEASQFADYWHAKTGKDATKLDWQATWRMWCRNAKPATGRKNSTRNMTEAEIRAENDRTTSEAAKILFGNSQEIIDV